MNRELRNIEKKHSNKNIGKITFKNKLKIEYNLDCIREMEKLEGKCCETTSKQSSEER